MSGAKAHGGVASRYLSEIRKTTIMSLPVITAQLAQMALGFIDTVMAGNLSDLDLAAVAIGRTIYMPAFIVLLGVLLAITPIVSQLLGAGKSAETPAVLWQGFWVAITLLIPAFFLVRNAAGFLTFMDVQPEIVAVSLGYLNALSYSLPAAVLYLVFRCFNDGYGFSRPHMYLTLLAIPLNVLLNYLFMYGAWGFERMGAVGAGWATTLVWYALLAGMFVFTRYHSKLRALGLLLKPHWPNRVEMGEIFRIGVPNGIGFGMEVSMFAMAALLIGSLGVTELAAHQIALNIASITFMIPLGIAIATTARVGYAIGENRPDRARIAGEAGILVSLAFMVLTGLLIISFPEALVSLYSREPETINFAVVLLFFAAIFQLPDGLQVSAAGALRGMKDTRIPMLVNMTSYWLIGIPLGYWLGLKQQMGAEGLWIGLIVGLSVAATAHTLRFYLLAKKRTLAAT